MAVRAANGSRTIATPRPHTATRRDTETKGRGVAAAAAGAQTAAGRHSMANSQALGRLVASSASATPHHDQARPDDCCSARVNARAKPETSAASSADCRMSASCSATTLVSIRAPPAASAARRRLSSGTQSPAVRAASHTASVPTRACSTSTPATLVPVTAWANASQ